MARSGRSKRYKTPTGDDDGSGTKTTIKRLTDCFRVVRPLPPVKSECKRRPPDRPCFSRSCSSEVCRGMHSHTRQLVRIGKLCLQNAVMTTPGRIHEKYQGLDQPNDQTRRDLCKQGPIDAGAPKDEQNQPANRVSVGIRDHNSCNSSIEKLRAIIPRTQRNQSLHSPIRKTANQKDNNCQIN